MKIVIGSDHNGVAFKKLLAAHLAARHDEVVDVGSRDESSADYPDFAFEAAELVASGAADRGILVCGSGIGMAMAANKVRGVRAALCHTPDAARLTRAHNDANVLALAGWQTAKEDVLRIVDDFLDTAFEGGRHERRVNKIKDYEEGHWKP
ncbi:MAG: ribose 5-phosphate isomerase B [Candidatus Krumholzibacteria bacterium]|nr:ribose 5-phosphate isomerase B [Candidatus Krumholzibacteria bacterium]